MAPVRKKVAILGGGTGAMAAAFGLTETPDWQDKYDITVYQLGWRLGGKGASGRNAKHQYRIEEHGLHVWAGFYDNAFRLMRQCYGKLARPPGHPLATVWDAFKPHSNVTLTDRTNGGWYLFNFDLPIDPDDFPGDGGVLPSVWAYVRMVLEWAGNLFRREMDQHAAGASHAGWIRVMVTAARSIYYSATGGVTTVIDEVATEVRVEAQHWLHPALHALLGVTQALPDDPHQHRAGEHHNVVGLLRGFKTDLDAYHDESGADNYSRMIWAMLDLAVTTVKGILEDGVLFHGFFSIDHWEWMDWLRRHGASETTLKSAVVKGTYDYIFGFENGDANRPSVGAGTCTHGLLRLGFTFKGAVFWEMQAGMGDTVFAPLYQWLSSQGVQFKFFHETEHLGLSADGKNVETIRLVKQVHLRDPNPEVEYKPLISVQDLPCWPSEPLYDQIDEKEAKELQEKGINLESPWADWHPLDAVTLTRGTDFDLIILGISVGALAPICTELYGKGKAQLTPTEQRWKNQIEKVQTVPTLAMQLWLTPTAAGLGWKYADRQETILTSFSDPLNTWGDMSHLLPREVWPAGRVPGSAAYFCGPLNDPAGGVPPFSDHGFPGRELAKVVETSVDFLNKDIAALWPNAFDPAAAQFKWDLLDDPAGGTGPARLESQYFRANVSPSERYVVSLPGTYQYRLRADGSGYANLYLAGDWVYTSINAGCVEAAVMAGFMASRAICGYPTDIVGEPE